VARSWISAGTVFSPTDPLEFRPSNRRAGEGAACSSAPFTGPGRWLYSSSDPV
jgi:hypothetical protein